MTKILSSLNKRFKRKAKKRNAGILLINTELLLDFFQFKGGKIHSIRLNPDEWTPRTIELVLEHPDMPEVEDGFLMGKVDPIYEIRYEHGHIVGMVRLEPKSSQK